MNAPRLCACGCGTDITGRDPRARYATDLCRTRDWKTRTRYGPQKRLQVRSNGNASRSGAQIAYGKVLSAFIEDGYAPDAARDRARRLLSERQRRQMDER